MGGKEEHTRQLASWVRAPPISGPADPAKAHITPSSPINKDLFLKLNKSEIVIVTKDWRPPPADPCSALAAINIGIFVLNAARILATAKIATPTSKAGLRPQISLHLAQMGPEAALARR